MAGNYPEKDALKGDKRLKEASQNGKASDQAQVATRPRPKADYTRVSRGRRDRVGKILSADRSVEA